LSRDTGTSKASELMRSLSLMGFAFNEPEVQHEGNNRECCDNLKTVKKFIQACHISYAIGLQSV